MAVLEALVWGWEERLTVEGETGGACERRCCGDERHKVTPASSEELQRSVSSSILGSEHLRLNSRYREKGEKVDLGGVLEYNHRNKEAENGAAGPIGRHVLPWEVYS